MTARPRPTVSIVIKALNEERNIATAIESALAALDGIDGEVVLADSASTDRTVAIAKNYPIKIVRMNCIEDRSCGAGGQLGYQYSCGDYVCLMDGDMKLYPDFVAAAISYLAQNPKVAGVGGMIVEREQQSFEYAKRATATIPIVAPAKRLISIAAASIAAPPSKWWATSPTAISTARKRWNWCPLAPKEGWDARAHRSAGDGTMAMPGTPSDYCAGAGLRASPSAWARSCQRLSAGPTGGCCCTRSGAWLCCGRLFMSGGLSGGGTVYGARLLLAAPRSRCSVCFLSR